ncbi:MAG: Uncharacterized protein XE11_1070 [Methanomicrobiales archaeon 53_19]|uniref:DUF1616 domain-containing protein n=1 Tax=Methanocalculus sp. TaxID=2004547 RepID=UPI00074AA39C|nr:DUF1616 domain-containing protein [Methanocalculus sp.]KUK70751.1 MAG: Uncharacterized protein XD88_0463 [Methanocalculus sp. 52_23]KUL03735.1 MAG: Uncharacterized protein XE11_1070 [Methanomicrobiales archaeon 53_19]HIJ07350.1 DUF1616 domain-containing protein [Methanocalculus sp.]
MPPEPADIAVDLLNPKTIPIDLKVALLWIIGTISCIYLPILQDTPLRVIFALPFILFIPGYLLIAALFPADDDLDWIERIALSFGLSIAVVPLIGLGLNYTPWGIRLDPIVTALVIFALAMAAIAAYRRLLLPQEKRLRIPTNEVKEGIRDELFPEESSRLDRALSIILICAIILAIGTTIYVIVVPKEGEKFTEFYILGEKGKAADYPTNFRAGTEQFVIIGIGNHEYRNVTYTAMIYGFNQQFDTGTNTSTILSSVPIGSFSTEIAHNETEERTFTFMVNDTSINRIQFLLFDEELPAPGLPPAELVNSSYRDLHLWVNVGPAA